VHLEQLLLLQFAFQENGLLLLPRELRECRLVRSHGLPEFLDLLLCLGSLRASDQNEKQTRERENRCQAERLCRTRTFHLHTSIARRFDTRSRAHSNRTLAQQTGLGDWQTCQQVAKFGRASDIDAKRQGTCVDGTDFSFANAFVCECKLERTPMARTRNLQLNNLLRHAAFLRSELAVLTVPAINCLCEDARVRVARNLSGGES